MKKPGIAAFGRRAWAQRALMAGLALGLASSTAASFSPRRFAELQLQQIVQTRIQNDRSGACVAVGLIEPAQTRRALVCSGATPPRNINSDTAFEIGSVSKTFSGALLALLIRDGSASLDDSLQQHLPEDVQAPGFGDTAIQLRHLLSHTAGLPPLPARMRIVFPANPYALLNAAQLHGSLADVQLDTAPGTRWAYSNFGAVLLSDAIGRAGGASFDALLRERLLEPLGMRHSFIGEPPEGVEFAQGHLSTGAATSAWDFPGEFAGVGGVRASLNDMLRYVDAQLGNSDAPAVAAALAQTQAEISSVDQRMAMGWMIQPQNGRDLWLHSGGTGGFTSFVAFDPEAKRGVVVLADTALGNQGGLADLGLHLLDPSHPLGSPRVVSTPEAELMDALVGEYSLNEHLRMSVRRRGNGLEIQAQGQPAFALSYDSAGDFYALDFDATLRPQDAGASFQWLQGGGVMSARRIEAGADVEPAQTDEDAADN
jgi:D-alanyl-D-alanine-carboxypeptidase/D-alanyl-D-alanine-endopeptidase